MITPMKPPTQGALSFQITSHNRRHATNGNVEVDMAARLRKTHQDDIRAKIQASQLINRLMGHIEGKVSLAPTQINAIKILLDKSLPNLSDVKIETGSQGITFNLNANLPKHE